jgi:uncharacterized protein YjaZ
MKPKIYIHFIESEKGLKEKSRKILEDIVLKHSLIACESLGVNMVNVSIYANQELVIPETGVGGYTISGEWFFVYINPMCSEKNIADMINKLIPGIVYHEMNHIARWNSAGYGTTLPDTMISEGLANIFAIDKWGKDKPLWSNYTKREIKLLLDIFQQRNKKDDVNYDHGEWFYGSGKLPRWIGYKLGSYLIRSVRLNHPEIGWEELVKMTSEKLIKLSQIKL